MKNDLYTKIVLTVIAIALTANLLKDVDFVTKAHAGEKEIDLSALRIEKAANTNNDGEMTFFIYENDKLTGGFGNAKYIDQSSRTSSPHFSTKNFANDNDAYKKAYINQMYDMPKYIITTKKGSFWVEK